MIMLLLLDVLTRGPIWSDWWPSCWPGLGGLGRDCSDHFIKFIRTGKTHRIIAMLTNVQVYIKWSARSTWSPAPSLSSITLIKFPTVFGVWYYSTSGARCCANAILCTDPLCLCNSQIHILSLLANACNPIWNETKCTSGISQMWQYINLFKAPGISHFTEWFEGCRSFHFQRADCLDKLL